MKHYLIKLIRFYQRKLSYILNHNPFIPIGTSCKFHPSCSDYAIDAVNKYGAVKGVLKAGARILRCNPFAKGGIDLLN